MARSQSEVKGGVIKGITESLILNVTNSRSREKWWRWNMIQTET